MLERVGNYRIIEEIASGGMAVVYKGVQESLQRTVAVKALRTAMAADASVVARFEREALSVASFQHENIVTLYDYFSERGGLFMVMEFVEGIDLYELTQRYQALPGRVAMIVALHVARALEYAHFRGIVHRDVKPANVMISKRGEVKLTDFGIARTEQSDLTEAGIGLGTPSYMSPEQIVGDPLDHRSDIWSLGVLLYQMTTGRKPFEESDDRNVMQRIRLDEPEAPRRVNADIDRDLEGVILRCLQKLPADRYNSTQELVVDIEQYLAHYVRENYRAKMVVFLKEAGVLSGDETLATLHPAMLGSEYRIGMPVRRWVQWRRPALLAVSALVIGLLGGSLLTRSLLARPASARRLKKTLPVAAVTAEPSYGELQILVQPWAKVVVDGKAIGTTPLATLKLPVGKHDVELSNPYGFATVSKRVTIKADTRRQLVVVLQRDNSVSADAG